MALPDVRRLLTLGIGLSVLGISLAVIARPQSTSVAKLTRHTATNGSYLVALGDAHNAWARVTFTREIWISPDGSGEILEHNAPLSFPSPSERGEWIAAGSPQVPAISQNFPPGSLFYLNLESVSHDAAELVSQLSEGAASPGDVIKRLSSLMTETVPPRDFINALVDASRGISGISVTETDNLITISGSAGDPADTRVTLIIDGPTGQLLTERRVVGGSIPTLEASAPIVMLERNTTLAELLSEWQPR